MAQHTTKSRRRKPDKPYPEFPLTANGNGQWSKVIRGKTFYFGVWEDHAAALALYKEQVDDLQAGRTPRPKTDKLTVRQVCNAYMENQESKRDKGKIASRTYEDCKTRCQRIVDAMGHLVAEEVGPADFTRYRRNFPTTWGPVMEAHYIKLTKAAFKFAWDQDLLTKPVKFGNEFQPPSKIEIRKSGKRTKTFTAAEVRKILTHLDENDKYAQLRAMVFLGINTGYGNKDCATLTEDMITNGWIDTMRVKTGVSRRCPMWEETKEAIEKVISLRRKTTPEGHIFVTRYGRPWFSDQAGSDPISKSFARVVSELGIKGSFYNLRHCFQTQCDQANIPRYVSQRLMGHADGSISGVYGHGVTDDQLYDAVMKVHDWLYPLVRGGEA